MKRARTAESIEEVGDTSKKLVIDRLKLSQLGF